MTTPRQDAPDPAPDETAYQRAVRAQVDPIAQAMADHPGLTRAEAKKVAQAFGF